LEGHLVYVRRGRGDRLARAGAGGTALAAVAGAGPRTEKVRWRRAR